MAADMRRLRSENNAPGVLAMYREMLKTPLRYYASPRDIGESLAWAYESLGKRTAAAQWYGLVAQARVWTNWNEASQLVARGETLDAQASEIAVARSLLDQERGKRH